MNGAPVADATERRIDHLDEADLTIFQAPWWLDAVSDRQWRAVTEGDGVRAFLWMPYVQSRKFGMRLLGMPPLTHTLGPVIRVADAQAAAETRGRLIDAALAQLPPHDGFLQVLDPDAGDALDYACNGLDVQIRYTYRIDTAAGADALWLGLKQRTRNKLRRAMRSMRVEETLSLMAFHAFYEANLHKRGLLNDHDRGLYERLDVALGRRSRHCILVAADRATGAQQAAVLLVWDRRTLYYLRSTRDPEADSGGAVSLLVWEAIKLAAEKRLAFDSDSFLGRGGALFMETFSARPVARLAISRRCLRLRAVETLERLVAGGA
ncbi:MAG: GNAT family N-acetyltransferase [Acidisphaera sp.]|nr:GNAT family N-acetyltransferase [Acidisphaera sp.]